MKSRGEQIQKIAKGIVSHPNNAAIVHPRDVPYIEAILTEAILFSYSDELEVAIENPLYTKHYCVFVKGYPVDIDVGRWCQNFLGPNRSDLFFNVKDTSVETPERHYRPYSIAVIKVKKILPVSKSEINCRRAILVWSLCGMRLGILRDLRKLIAERVWKTRFELMWMYR